MIKHALIFSVSLLLLNACSVLKPSPKAASNPETAAVLAAHPARLTAIGYGAAAPYDSYTPGQKRLLAMRASKLDAYRALVEQVYGVRVTGNSTVAGLVAQHDSFRVYVDAYLRGVKVVTVTPMADGNYETVLELELGDQFYQTMSQPQVQPQATLQSGVANPAQVAAAQNCSGKGNIGPGCGYAANFYYAE